MPAKQQQREKGALMVREGACAINCQAGKAAYRASLQTRGSSQLRGHRELCGHRGCGSAGVKLDVACLSTRPVLRAPAALADAAGRRAVAAVLVHGESALADLTTEKKFILFDRDLRVWHIIS